MGERKPRKGVTPAEKRPDPGFTWEGLGRNEYVANAELRLLHGSTACPYCGAMNQITGPKLARIRWLRWEALRWRCSGCGGVWYTRTMEQRSEV